jgi:hypothetical protein
LSARIEYIADDDTLTIELPGARVGDRVKEEPPCGLLYWYDRDGILRGITIPAATAVLGWEPEENMHSFMTRGSIYDADGRCIGWEERSGKEIF